MAADESQQALVIPFPLRSPTELNRRTSEFSIAVLARLDTLEASGATASRPTAVYVGQPYFDTTIGKPVWWNGTTWVDATGTAA